MTQKITQHPDTGLVISGLLLVAIAGMAVSMYLVTYIGVGIGKGIGKIIRRTR